MFINEKRNRIIQIHFLDSFLYCATKKNDKRQFIVIFYIKDGSSVSAPFSDMGLKNTANEYIVIWHSKLSFTLDTLKSEDYGIKKFINFCIGQT